MVDPLWGVIIKIKASLSILGWLLSVAVSHTHHSFYAYFDFRGRVTVEGVITAVRMAHPHSRITMEVENSQGELEIWQIETGSGRNLALNGWTEEAVPVGLKVTAMGFPSHSGRPIMELIKFTFEDGREVQGEVDRYLKPTEADSVEE